MLSICAFCLRTEALSNLLVFSGSFLGDIQCSEHYSASDCRKLEMCAKFHCHTSTNMEDTQGAEGVAIPQTYT